MCCATGVGKFEWLQVHFVTALSHRKNPGHCHVIIALENWDNASLVLKMSKHSKVNSSQKSAGVLYVHWRGLAWCDGIV